MQPGKLVLTVNTIHHFSNSLAYCGIDDTIISIANILYKCNLKPYSSLKIVLLLCRVFT